MSIIEINPIDSCYRKDRVHMQSLFHRAPKLGACAHFRIETNGGFKYPLHRHDDTTEMLLITEGEGQFVIDGRSYRGGPGTLLFYQQNIWHEETSVQHPFHATYIAFKNLQFMNLPSNHFLEPERDPIFALQEHFLPIKQLFNEIVAEQEGALPENIFMTNQLLGMLFVRLTRIVYPSNLPLNAKKNTTDMVAAAKRYMEENYPDDITLQKLARVLYLNEYYLCHLFKEKTGLSPIQFLIRYRMDVAKQILATSSGATAGQVAEMVGYKSETYFQNLFKKIVGVTPGQYKKSLLGR